MLNKIISKVMKKKIRCEHFPEGKWQKILLIMKLKLFILLCCIHTLGATTYSQNQKLDVKFENELIVSVLDYLKMQTGYQFFFQKGVVPETEKITVNLKNATLWILAVATAFSVIFAKEVFGGTGMNVFNVALITRAFLFFAYPTKMSGDAVWVSGDSIFGLGQTVDGLTVATPLGAAATAGAYPEFSWDMVTGLIPGSIGETSVIAIALGAILLLWTGIASWKTMFSVFVGGAFMGWVFNTIGPDTAMANMPWYEHLVLGGFCFGAVFMATDPVTSARTETGKYIFGFLIGAMAIIIRVLNPGYPEGMMLAILLMNIFAPLIDYCVVQGNISRREKRATAKSNN